MWNERYAEPGYAYGVEPNDFLVQQVGRLPAGGRVLELCAGEGRNGVWLAARGFAVTSVDGSAVGLAKASALAAERKTSLRTVVSDLAAYDVAAEPWDVIVSIFAHLPPPLRQRVHAAAVVRVAMGADYETDSGGIAAQYFAHMAEHILLAAPGDVDHAEVGILLNDVAVDEPAFDLMNAHGWDRVAVASRTAILAGRPRAGGYLAADGSRAMQAML